MSTETTTTETATPVLRFEHTTCSRCGGTGHYSFNLMHGTVCFRCSGRKETLTKRGAAAQQWLRDRMMVRIDSLQPGDRVRFSPSEKYRTVVAVLPQSEAGAYRIDRTTGQRIEEPDLRCIRTNWGDHSGHRFDALVQRYPGDTAFRALMLEALDYQSTLTQAGKPRRSKPSGPDLNKTGN